MSQSSTAAALNLSSHSVIRDSLARLGILEARNPQLFAFLYLLTSLPAVEKIDHCTFVTPASERKAFLEHWTGEGFGLHGIWKTPKYPADHIALVQGGTPSYPWMDMVGLSVAEDLNAPIASAIEQGRGLTRQGTHQLQHIAFNISSNASLAEVQAILEGEGLPFMTEVLSYQDEAGAGIRQTFSAPNGYFFYEFIQRIPNPDGRPYDGFDPDIIDDLYRALHTRAGRSTANDGWVPPSVGFEQGH